MKKTIYCSMIVLAGLFFAAACSKDKPVVPNDPTEEAAGITLPEKISVAIPDNITRVSLTQDEEDADGAVKLAWDEDDKIYVAAHDNSETWITYAIDTPLGENPHVATFSKVGEEEITASSFDILYGAPTLAMAESIDISVQTQEGNANTDHLQYMALISGVNTVENVQFSSDWATEKGGDFKQNGIVRLRLQMPANVTAVSSVFLAASSAVFNTTNKQLDEKTDMIKVNFSSNVDISADHIVTVFANLPWEDVSVPAGTDLTAVVKGSDGYYYSKAINASGITFSTGSVNAIKLNRSGFNVFAGGSGVEGDPYTIATKWHLMNTKPCTDAAEDASVTYFKLLNDIDMSGLTWDMLNPTSPYEKLIDFDGNNNTISKLGTSFFYVLRGSVKDLKLDDTIVGSGSQRGVLAQYIQKTGNVVDNVDISNSSVNGGTNSGALIGRINSGTAGSISATITDCDIINTPVKGGCVGGLLGSVEAKVVVTNCSYSGNTVTGTTAKIGGLVGVTSDNIGCSFTGCRVENATIDASSLSGDVRAGGFIGQLGEGSTVYGCTVGTASQKVAVKAGKYDATNSKSINTGGFVGVNYGIITKDSEENHSKAYVTVTSTNDTGNPLNLGGFAGFQRGTVSYSDAVVSMGDLQGQYIGGFCGYIVFQSGKTVITDHCTVIGDIRGNNYTGGFVGVAEKGDFTISNCQVLEGTVVVGQSTAGGFAGQISTGTVEDCSADVTMQSRGGNSGGFVGAILGGSVLNCSSTGTLSQISGTNTTFGGFAGYVNGADLKKCYSTVNIDVARSYVGGLIGDLKTANTVSECYYDGTISGPANTKGGLIGVVQAVAAVITNCYTAGELIGSSGTQIYGGIVGELKSDASVTNCYSTMDLSHAGRATGGIIGRACNGGWPVSNAANNTVSKCIAWNPAITFDGTPGTSASSGAIIGYTSFKNTLNNCYRHPDMVYLNSNTAVGTTCQTSMVDQIDCDGTNWAINGNRPAGSTPAGTSADAQYQAPYYGVAAASDATVSSIAQALGWSSDVWDFTGDLPTLK